jgi:hypothetical protein
MAPALAPGAAQGQAMGSLAGPAVVPPEGGVARPVPQPPKEVGYVRLPDSVAGTARQIQASPGLWMVGWLVLLFVLVLLAFAGRRRKRPHAVKVEPIHEHH